MLSFMGKAHCQISPQHHQRPGTILPGKDIFQQDNVFYHIAQADCCKYFQECEENLILLHW